MPMLDAIIPEGALSDEAEKKLCSQLTDILLRTEGADPKRTDGTLDCRPHIASTRRDIRRRRGGEGAPLPDLRLGA
jgi:hypothetical protein